jgi:hypothetical protein
MSTGAPHSSRGPHTFIGPLILAEDPISSGVPHVNRAPHSSRGPRTFIGPLILAEGPHTGRRAHQLRAPHISRGTSYQQRAAHSIRGPVIGTSKGSHQLRGPSYQQGPSQQQRAPYYLWAPHISSRALILPEGPSVTIVKFINFGRAFHKSIENGNRGGSQNGPLSPRS